MIRTALACAALSMAAAAEFDASAFLAACGARATAAAAEQRLAVPGADGWWFLTAELRHLGAGPLGAADAKDSADDGALAAILDTHRQLAALGIDLLVVPVPPRAVLYADRTGIAGAPAAGVRADPEHRAFYGRLREQGVRVIDLAPDLLAARGDEATAGAVCCRTDSHWSPRGLAIAARAIRTAVGEAPWLATAPKADLATHARTLTITGDLAAAAQQTLDPEALPAVEVTRADGSALKPDRASPLVLLADSHGLVFHAGGDMHATGCGLPEQLALAFGVVPEVVAKKGSAATGARVALATRLRDAAYRTGKKLVVWCFAGRDLSEGGPWQQVPLTRP